MRDNTRERTDQANARLRHGGYATILTALVIAVLVGLNLLVDSIPLTADLTVERFYSLSDQTRTIVGRVDQDVVLTTLYEPGREDRRIGDILRNYEKLSPRIRLANIDPYRDPGRLQRYTVGGEPPGVGSVVVESGARFRVIRAFEFYEWSIDDGERYRQEELRAEQVLTSAILSVTADADPLVYSVRGHGEMNFPLDLLARLAQDGFAIRDVNLITTGRVPADATAVLMNAPATDISGEEERLLREYVFERRGNLLVTVDLQRDETPRLDALLASLGVTVERLLVVEGSSDRHIPQAPLALIPLLADHPVTRALDTSGMPLIFPYAQPVTPAVLARRTVRVEPLLSTSARAWGRVAWQSGGIDRATGDPGGPFVLAVAITDAGLGGQEPARAVIIGSSHFLYPPESIGRLPENYNLVVNALNWLKGEEELLEIRPKSISGRRYLLFMSQAQFMVFAVVSVVVLPALVLAAGLIYWARRRRL